MANYIKLPDGKYYEAPEGFNAAQAYAKARQDYPESFGITPPTPETGFTAGLKSGFESLKGDIGAIGAGLGIEGGAEYAKAQREKAAQIAQTPELTEDPWGYVTTLLGQSAAYMAAPIAGAALVGSAPVSGALGLSALGAGMLGAGAVSATQFTGSNLSRQLEEGTAPEDLQLGAAVAAAVPQAALDTVALKFIPGVNKLVGKFGRELTKEESLNAARKLAQASAAGVIKAGGVKTLQTAGIEGLTEAGQVVFERMQAGLDLMDEQARNEYIDNFVGGATLGGLFGAGSRIGAQSRAKAEVAQEEQRIAAEQPVVETMPEVPEQPVTETAAPPAPPAPVGSGITLSDQYDALRNQLAEIQDQLAAGPDLDTQDALITQLEETQAKMQELAPAVIERGGVTMSEQDLAEAEQGLTSEETALKAKLDKTEKDRLVALEQMDVEKAKKLGEKTRQLQAQIQELPGKRQALDPFRQRLEELRARQATPVGQTTEMFTAATEGEKAKATPVKFENMVGAPVTGMPTAEREAERALVREEKAAVPKEQVEQIKQLENELATTLSEARKTKDTNLVGPQSSWGGPFTLQGPRGAKVFEVIKKINEAQNKLSRTVNQDERAGESFNNTFDIFSVTNFLREAIRRGDERTILNITRANDSEALNKLLDEKKTERDRLAEILGKKMGTDTRGVKRERANLFDAFYPDPKERARFANGTNEEKIERQKIDRNGNPVFNKKTGQPVMERIRLQDVYDKGGKAAVEYEIVMDRVTDLVGKVTKPQGNAKKSLYAEAVDLYNQIEELKAQQASGIDTPTLADKAKDLNAKFGKGEPAGERQLTKMGAYNLQRKIDGLTNRYNALIGRITPIRDKVLAEYASLYTTTKTSVTEEEAKNIERAKQREAKKAEQKEQERSGYLRDLAIQYGQETDAYTKFAETTTNPKLLEEKALELGKKDKRFKKSYEAEMEDRAGEVKPKVSKSRAAATQARIARGNLRPEAEKDLATRNVAFNIGVETKEFEQFNEGLSKRLDALRKKYGENDPAVQAFKLDAGNQRKAKAIELGKKTPAYRQALAEQTKKLQEASAGATAAGFPQTTKSKRTPQETRRSSGAPKTIRTGATGEEKALVYKGPRGGRQGAADFAAVPSGWTAENQYYDVLRGVDEAASQLDLSDAPKRFLRGVETDSVALSDMQVRMLEKNNLPGALDAIVTDDRIDPVSRTVAKVLRKFLDYTSVEIKNTLIDDGKEVLGAANSTNIWLNRNGGLSIEALLHEGTHAAAERIVQLAKTNPSALTKEQRLAINELNAIYNAVRNDPAFTSSNAKSSLTEFVAEVMSNRNLQAQLSKRKWTMSNMWNAFKSSILRLLGIKPDEVKTMLGASMVSVEALFIPSSMRTVGGVETKTEGRTLSAKDIAALATDSNSMRQFAEQFGSVIKQSDRTPEDVERIAIQQMDAIMSSANKGLPVVTAGSITPAFKRLVIMSDGKEFDPDNMLHYAEATAETFAALDFLKQDNGVLRDRTARSINNERKDAITSLFNYLVSKYNNFTMAETALVLKAATQFGVISGEDGKLKLVKLDKNNEHPVAVIGATNTNAIIEELRAGKGLKEAFIDGMQKAADAAAQKNTRFNGWKKFEQSKEHEAAVALNEGAANTSWCTGASLGHAKSQIESGDFYIYYKNGKPEVAVRMVGSGIIGEVRGNTPKQALTDAQQKIAKEFLQNSSFADTQDYLQDFNLKQALVEAARTDQLLPEEIFLNIVPHRSWIDDDGVIKEKQIIRALEFRSVLGYAFTPSVSPTVIKKFIKLVEKSSLHFAKQERFVLSRLIFKNGDFEPVKLFGEKFSPTISTVKSAQALTISGLQPKTKFSFLLDGDVENRQITLPVLEHVNELVLGSSSDDLILPALKTLNNISPYKSAVVSTPANVKIGQISPVTDSRISELTIKGAKNIGNVQMSSFGRAINVDAPDALYANVIYEDPTQFKTEMFSRAFEKYLKNYNLVPRLDALRLMRLGVDTDVDKKSVELVEQKLKRFALDLVEAQDRLTGRDTIYDFDNYWKETVNSADLVENGFSDVVATLFKDASAIPADELNIIANRVFASSDGLVRMVDTVNLAPPTFEAPNWVADRPPIQTLIEAKEKISFAPKSVGVVEKSKGVFSFVRKNEPVSSVVAQPKGFIDNLFGNLFGLTGRVQLIDQYAATETVGRKGVSAGQIKSEEATNVNYLLRFGQQVSQFAGQFMTNGPVVMETSVRNGVTTSLYRSTKGTSMMDVAQALSQAKLGSDTQQEVDFTLYLAGERARQVGWDKLNFESPAKAQAEYQALLQKLALNPEAEKAFKAARNLYKEYNAGLLDFLVQTGYLTQQKAAELKSITYVPFYRIKDGAVDLMIDKERAVRLSNIKDEPILQQLIGDNKSILPIFTSAAQNTFLLTRMGLRNQAVKETSFMLQKLGVATRLTKGKGPASADVVRFKRKGEDYYALIDADAYGVPAELIVRGMEGIKTTIPVVFKAMGVPATVLRNFVVRNPAYAVRQVIRDPLNAWLTNGTDAPPVLSSMKELAKMVAGRSPTENALMSTGAISSNVYSGDERDMAKFIKDISSGRSGWDKLVARADAFALQGDSATRAVIYEDSLKKGLSEQEALLRTLESMNFSRRGVSPSMQVLSVLIPFFNAQIQGLDVLYRAYKGELPFSQQLQIKEKMIRRAVLMAGLSMAYALLMEDDEEYKRARPEERLANWFVPNPFGEGFIKVPIPFEMGFLFKALPEAMINVAFGDERAGNALKGLRTLLGQSNPFSMPQAVKPLTEVYLGKSFFGGDIESQRERTQMLATDRYRDNTTEVSRLLGAVTGKLGVSAISLDHLIRGYTGSLGIAIIQLANPLLAPDTRAEIAAPSMKPNQTPFIGGLFQNAEGRGTLDEAYDRMLEIQQIKGTYNRLVQSGQRAEAIKFAQENANEIALMSVSGTVQQRLGALAATERKIKASPYMTQQQKDERLKRLYEAKMRIADRFLSLGR